MEFNAKNMNILVQEATKMDEILASKAEEVLRLKLILAVQYELYHLADSLKRQIEKITN